MRPLFTKLVLKSTGSQGAAELIKEQRSLPASTHRCCPSPSSTLPCPDAVAKQKVLLAGILAHAVLCGLCPQTCFHWQVGLFRTGLHHSPQASLPPKQMGTSAIVPGTKSAHQFGAPNERLVSRIDSVTHVQRETRHRGCPRITFIC